MRMPARLVVQLGLFALLSGSAFGAERPNFDALGARPPAPGKDTALLQRVALAVSPGARVQTESRLGVPTFLWVAGSRGSGSRRLAEPRRGHSGSLRRRPPRAPPSCSSERCTG